MAPFQLFFLLSTLAVFSIAWLKGGHPERQGVAIMIVAYIASLFAAEWVIDRIRVLEFVIDVAMLVALIPLGIRSPRWWPMAAIAGQILVVVSYIAVMASPEISIRDNVGTRWVLSCVVLYCLLGGVLERWLAGEPPVMHIPRRRQDAPNVS